MKKLIYSAAIILTLSLAACSNTEDYSPQEILNQAMQETSELTSYYGEYKMTMSDGTETNVKQWEKDGKNRVEVVDEGDESLAINDGNTLTSYTKSTNKATIFELDGEGMGQMSIKDQALRTLEMIKDSHKISIGNDEKIAGHATYHLIAKANKEDSLFGDMEIWVDKKTWMVLKSVSKTGDETITSEFTKFEPNAEIDDAIFIADLPEDVEIEYEKMEPPAKLTIEQAKEKLGAFLIVPESTGYTLEFIEDMDVEETNEIALTYTNDEEQFSISVFKPVGALDDEDEQIEIRGLKGSLIDLEVFKLVQWDENGLRYNIMFENPDVPVEDIVKIANEMIVTP